MGDTTSRVWIRLVGGAVLLAMVVASAVIVGQSSPASRQPVTGSDADEDDEPEPPPQPESVTDTFSPEELVELQACISADARLTGETSNERLRNLLGASNTRQKQTDAHADLVRVALDVEQLRGFRFTDPVKTRFVSSEKIGELVGEPLSAKQAKAAEIDDLALTALGVLRPGENLKSLYAELVTDQVAGFYRPRENELVVPSPGPGESLAAFDKAVLAHELEHALIDQTLGFPLVAPQPADKDGSLAALAVIEGSATLTGYRWTQAGLSLFDQFALTSDPRVAGSEGVPPALPSYLVRQFTFPYFEGLKFVCALYDRGGWRLVNKALRHPPTTTLEILTPELFVNGYKPPTIARPSSPGSGWKHVFQTTFGAAQWTWLLEAPGDNRALGFEGAERLAAHWAGGKLHVWTRGDDTAVAVVGKSRGGNALCTLLKLWNDVLYREDSQAALSCPGNEIRLGIAPSDRAARRIVH